ncbi:MAG: hypothetical protein AAB305_03310, partial [Candidatus Zixiibacteriota bacterium]
SAGYFFGFAIIVTGGVIVAIGRRFDRRQEKLNDAPSVSEASMHTPIEAVSPSSEPMASDV